MPDMCSVTASYGQKKWSENIITAQKPRVFKASNNNISTQPIKKKHFKERSYIPDQPVLKLPQDTNLTPQNVTPTFILG